MEERNLLVLCNKEVFQDVAEELGLSKKEVEKIFYSQSKLTKKVMESNTFDSVRWPYFGAFKTKSHLVQIMNHMKGLDEEQKKIFKQQIRDGKLRKKFNNS